MKFLRIFTIFLYFFVFSAGLFPESMISNIFPDYGIKNIAIYTEAYTDLRSENFLAEINAMETNAFLKDPAFYRYKYCNFDIVTPPLATPEYPLYGSAEGIIDESLTAGISDYLHNKGWLIDTIKDFSGGSLSDLLGSAADKGIDAVLVVRYTPINYFVPIENYNENWLSGRTSAAIGHIKPGIGYIPALELYDSRTAARLWYSAYHTGHQVISQKKGYQDYVDKAEEFFTEIDISGSDIKVRWAAFELSGNPEPLFSATDADERAAETMIRLAMDAVEYPFPDAEDSGKRSVSLKTAGSLRHLFWTDYPSYRLHGIKWGIGYNFDYLGDYNLYFRDESYGRSDDDPSQVISSSGAVMHRITVPFYSTEVGNLSVNPEFFAGYIPPYTDTVTWNNIGENLDGEFYVKETVTEEAVISAWSVGFGIDLRYYLRFTDETSFFIGGQGTAQTYFPLVGEGPELSEEGSLRGHGEGLLFIDGPDLTLTAAVTAGIRFDREDPFEIFALYTPVAQAGSPMLSAGIKWLPLTWGWINPHRTRISDTK